MWEEKKQVAPMVSYWHQTRSLQQNSLSAGEVPGFLSSPVVGSGCLLEVSNRQSQALALQKEKKNCQGLQYNVKAYFKSNWII